MNWGVRVTQVFDQPCFLTEITGHNSRKKLYRSVIQWFDAKYLKDYTIDLTVHHRGLKERVSLVGVLLRLMTLTLVSFSLKFTIDWMWTAM